MGTITARLAALEDTELTLAVANFRQVWRARKPNPELVRETLGEWGHNGVTLEAIAAFRAALPTDKRATFEALRSAVRALLDPHTPTPRLRAALGALAPHMELPSITPPHLIANTFTATMGDY